MLHGVQRNAVDLRHTKYDSSSFQAAVMLARISCSVSLENGRNICLDAALSGLILPPSCLATKQDWRPLRTLLVKYQTSSRRDATSREEETKTNIYFTLMLLYYYCFFYPSLLSPTLLQSLILYLILGLQNPTISGTTSQINIKLPSFATRHRLQTSQMVPSILTHRWAHTDTSRSHVRPTLTHIFLQ